MPETYSIMLRRLKQVIRRVLVVCGLVAWRVLESTITLLDLSCVRRILWCVAGGVLRVVPGGLKLIHQ